MSKEQKTTLSPDSQFGRYEIRSLLGVGGMGEVYLAYDSKLRRQVALKLLPAELTQNKDRLARFEREAYAASSLNHPNIMTIHEIGEEAGHHFIASEYVEGESLRQHLKRSGLELRETLGLTSQIADALSVAHDAGIVHRDVKPENVMIRRDGYVKILDFGLAKLAHESTTAANEEDLEAPTRVDVHTEPGVVMGTANYMSPEQARGLDVDARSDIWSVGVVLYEMVAGKLPFEGRTTTDVLAMILHREPPSLLLFQPSPPAELERIVEKALAKECETRYQTAKDLSVDLKRLRQRLEVEAEIERSITPEEESRRTWAGSTSIRSKPELTNEVTVAHTISSAEFVAGEIKRHKRVAAAVLATLVLAIAAAVVYYIYSSRRSVAFTSVAVLPFANLSGDPNMEYLSDGISESLINNLSQLQQLKVIARSSTFRYKGKEIDPEEVAKTLGVGAIVTGRVIQRGDDLQISVELVNTQEKTQMWGEQYNRRATDLQAVQAEIARTVSEKLRVRLTGAQERQLAKQATQNPQAYQLYLNGVFYARKGNIENQKKALDYFAQAVALDPKFALAYASMPSAYFNLTASGADPKELLAKGRTAAQKALELDDSLAEAHSGLALIKSNEWDWSGAESEFKRAIELNTNLAAAHSSYANYLSRMGRTAEALAENKRAQELDPLRISTKSLEGTILYFARRYDEAIQVFQNVIKLQPDYATAQVYLGYTYAMKGQYAEAIAAYQKYINLDGETTSTLCYLGYAYAKSGKRDEALATLNKLKTKKEYVSPAELAALYFGLGDKEAALESLERAYREHDLQMQYLKVDPHFDALRSEARFQDLMRRVGLPQ